MRKRELASHIVPALLIAGITLPGCAGGHSADATGAIIYIVTESKSGQGFFRSIDTSTGKAGRAIKVDRDPPDIVLMPNNRTAYIASWNSQSITPVDLRTYHVKQPIAIAQGPEQLVAAPDGRTVYVAHNGTTFVTLINTYRNSIAGLVSIENKPAYSTVSTILVSPTGHTAYVANGLQDVVPINTETNV